VLWLSRVASGVASSVLAAVDVLQRLVHLQHVPLQQAKQLVADGVRIPYAQLLAAAKSKVAGVEVWVQAQRQFAVTSDIPAAAVAICCGEIWVSVHSTVGCRLPKSHDHRPLRGCFDHLTTWDACMQHVRPACMPCKRSTEVAWQDYRHSTHSVHTRVLCCWCCCRAAFPYQQLMLRTYCSWP
jgi:hypothetical protein